MASFVYVLGCRTPERCLTYVGWTTDVERRLKQHNGGKGARTTRGRAWILLHTEKFRTRRQAMSREWHLKRDRKFRKRLAQDANRLISIKSTSNRVPKIPNIGRLQKGLAMKASDVMVSKVITVGPNATVQEIANILLSNRISAVPVIDSLGALIGIVSEGDLIHRVEAGTERHYSWWLNLLADKATLAHDYVKSHALKAADVMTKRVITASPDLSLGELASLLEKQRIKRVPIVENGKLVGIVSRANLLQALVALRRDVPTESRVDDSVLRERVLSEIRSKLWASATQINVIVHGGVVELWGIVEAQDEKKALRVAAELTPGVRSVEDHVAIDKIHYGM